MINLIKGNIEQQDTDVIVNSSNKYLAWEETTMNGDVHSAGGKQFTLECAKWNKVHNGLTHREVAVISAYGDLKCKEVYNVLSPTYREDEVFMKYKLMMENFMNTFKKSKHNSISIPLIGTGVFRIPMKFAMDMISYYTLAYDSEDEEYNIVFYDDEQLEKGTELFNNFKDIYSQYEES